MTKTHSTLPLIRTAYDGLNLHFSDLTATSFEIPEDHLEYHPSRSLTVQSESDEFEINNIVAKYHSTGVLPQSRTQAFFGDASALPDFMAAQQMIVDANTAFDALPAKVRDRFHNNPENLLNFLGDTSNEAEARALGLLDTPSPAPSGDSQRAQNAGGEAPDIDPKDQSTS